MLRTFSGLRPLNIVSLRRNLRSSTNRERRLPKFVKGKVVTLDSNVDDQLGPPDTYHELNRVLKRMFTDPEQIQSEAELEMETDKMSSMFTHKGKAEEMNLEELRRYNAFMKRKIVEKKYFSEPHETNLLTYAAKKQIRYLNQLDPVEWSPQRISECFPISVSGAVKLLKNNFTLNCPQKIAAHDAEVAKRWETLRSGENLSSISPVTLRLWQEGKLVQDFYSGNVNLPQPPEPEPEVTEVRAKPKKVGEHLAIVKKYVDLKRDKEDKLIAEKSSMALQLGDKSSEGSSKMDIQKTVLPCLSFEHVPKSEAEDMLSTSFLATSDIDKDEPDVQCEQFKANLTEEFSEKTQKSAADEAYLEWLKQQSEPQTEPFPYTGDDELNFQTVKKYSHETVELTTEWDGQNNIAYTHSNDPDYQYHVKEDIIRNQVKIPARLYKKGAVYRRGRCFYDDSGEFLYRLPFEIKS